jgi:hypothetical protein
LCHRDTKRTPKRKTNVNLIGSIHYELQVLLCHLLIGEKKKIHNVDGSSELSIEALLIFLLPSDSVTDLLWRQGPLSFIIAAAAEINTDKRERLSAGSGRVREFASAALRCD